LVTVEWSPDGQFELTESDAEILIQIHSGDLLWQKERLLNLALKRLPQVCRHVAWLDCDVIFDNPEWPNAAMRLLGSATVIQLFSEAAHTPAYPLDIDITLEMLRLAEPVHRELCWLSKHVLPGVQAGKPNDLANWQYVRRSGRRCIELPSAPGIAWAARREVLEATGFYDANIVGGGDTAMALACIGQAVQLPEKRALSDAHLRHYIGWAESFCRAVDQHVAFLTGKIYHLWHGEFSSRQYKDRHLLLQEANFDPVRDVKLSADSVWEWGDVPEPLREAVRTYFSNRREDG
jgi:hypothetical protein